MNINPKDIKFDAKTWIFFAVTISALLLLVQHQQRECAMNFLRLFANG
jgi:hypothetical protein